MTRRAPVLVTGVPRSGTTWLARELAASPGTALGGREPINPRGRQHALAGTLDGWARLTTPTARQRRALALAYRGADPRVFSRYGHRQWAAPLPWTRVVVKDPFALLSLPAVVATTGARPVLVLRHPAAVLGSYRRMGWSPDLEELAGVLAAAGDVRDPAGEPLHLPAPGTVGEAEAMASFWHVLHALALADAASLPGLVVVDHEDVAAADGCVLAALRADLGLAAPADTPADTPAAPTGSAGDTSDAGDLHRLDRSPEQAATAWRAHVDPEELAVVERVTASTRARLAELRLRG